MGANRAHLMRVAAEAGRFNEAFYVGTAFPGIQEIEQQAAADTYYSESVKCHLERRARPCRQLPKLRSPTQGRLRILRNEVFMTYGDKPIHWRIARLFVTWWVKMLIDRHVRWLDKTAYQRSNVNYAKGEFSRARINYWRKQFQPWGTWCIYGYRAISFSNADYNNVIDAELTRLGFDRPLLWPVGGGVGDSYVLCQQCGGGVRLARR